MVKYCTIVLYIILVISPGSASGPGEAQAGLTALTRSRTSLSLIGGRDDSSFHRPGINVTVTGHDGEPHEHGKTLMIRVAGPQSHIVTGSDSAAFQPEFTSTIGKPFFGKKIEQSPLLIPRSAELRGREIHAMLLH
jgi:hypothetical protein